MSEHKKKLIITICLVAFAILAFAFVNVFLRFKIKAEKNAILEIRKQLAFYDKKMNSFASVKKSFLKNKESFSKIEDIFLNQDSMVLFVKQMESLAQQCGVELEVKTAGLIAFGSQQAKIPSFLLTLKGSFSSIYKYLYLLENNKYQVSISSINLEKNKDKDVWEASLKINFLSFVSNEGS